LSRAQLEVALVEMDTDGDGTISLREFIEWSQGSEFADNAWEAYASAGEDAEGAEAPLLAPLLAADNV
jgi:Ca2+-binding EF-hand superfamily protein